MNYMEKLRDRLSTPRRTGFGKYALAGKEGAKEFARRIGVRVPETYFQGTLSKMPTVFPENFVFKPAFASTSIGVRLLERTASGDLKDLTSGEVLTREQLFAEATAIAERFKGEDADKAIFILEELLVAPDGSKPPKDVRFYAFQGEIGLILMESHLDSPARAMYFDGGFRPFKDLHERYGIAPNAKSLEVIEDAVIPQNWKELLQVAKRISVALPTAFCRIDLYDAQGGVCLGELTYTPGTFYYENRKLMSPAESERLGRMWTEAEERLVGSFVDLPPVVSPVTGSGEK